MLFLRLVCVGLLTALAWVHFHLWDVGYRHIPTIGPLFLVTAIGALTAAVGMLVRASRFFGVLALGLVMGAFAALIVSINVGLFGFTESLSAPYVVESVVLEMLATVTLASWVVLDLMLDSRHSERFNRSTLRVTASNLGATRQRTTSEWTHFVDVAQRQGGDNRDRSGHFRRTVQNRSSNYFSPPRHQ